MKPTLNPTLNPALKAYFVFYVVTYVKSHVESFVESYVESYVEPVSHEFCCSGISLASCLIRTRSFCERTSLRINVGGELQRRSFFDDDNGDVGGDLSALCDAYLTYVVGAYLEHDGGGKDDVEDGIEEHDLRRRCGE